MTGLRSLLIAGLFLGAAAHSAELVFNEDFPDPAIVRAPDGGYYAYATQGIPQGTETIQNIQVARSVDLRKWERVGDAMPRKPQWAASTQAFWAPDVSLHRGTYYLYFSAKPDQGPGMCIGVATSSQPGGPFQDVGKPLQCGPGFVDIDPMSYDDPRTGKRWLYWGSGFGPIRARELARDRVRFEPGSAAVEVLHPEAASGRRQGGGYRRLLEAAWVLESGGYYYLFTSGDNCCEPGPHYAVMVVRSKSPLGPFEYGPNWVEQDSRWLAPGHSAAIVDDAGERWMFYHAIDRQNPHLSKPIPGDRTVRRVLLRQRLEFRNGWPVPVSASGRAAK